MCMQVEKWRCDNCDVTYTRENTTGPITVERVSTDFWLSLEIIVQRRYEIKIAMVLYQIRFSPLVKFVRNQFSPKKMFLIAVLWITGEAPPKV